MSYGIFNQEARERIRETVRTVEGIDAEYRRPAMDPSLFNQFRFLIGKTNASHAKGASGTINVYRGQTKGSETFTGGDTVSAYNRFAAVASGKWVIIARINGGWELISAEC